MKPTIGKVWGLDSVWGITDAAAPEGLVRPIALFGNVQGKRIDGPIPCDDTTGLPTDFTVTLTGTSTLAVSATQGSSLLITTDTSEYDGVEAQVKGTVFQCNANEYWYLGGKFTISDATHSDFLFGMCGIDTTLTAAATAHAIGVAAGGVFFSKLDEATTMYVKTYKTNAENNSASAATLSTSQIFLELQWDGVKIDAYVDSELVATFTEDLPTVVLTPSISFRAGAAAAKTCAIESISYWQAWA